MPERFDGNWPPAYFITFSTYGTRLHGDERGTVNRWHNRIGEPPLPARPGLESVERRLLKHAPATLDGPMRAVVDSAMRERCGFMSWELLAINVRTNHVHLVVAAQESPEKVMTSLKARATKLLREHHLISESTRLWTRHGSTRYLWTASDINDAALYVTEGQGPDLTMA